MENITKFLISHEQKELRWNKEHFAYEVATLARIFGKAGKLENFNFGLDKIKKHLLLINISAPKPRTFFPLFFFFFHILARFENNLSIERG